MLKFIKDWTLPLAMLIGVLLYPLASRLIVLTPYLIFAMLLLTFSKLSPRQIKIQRAHLWLLLIQLFGSVGVYLLIRLYHPIVAQGAFICMLVPTATSAAVIVGMLGGNVGFLTAYLLVCNIAVAIAGPALFPFIGPHHETPFWEAFIYICREVGPILLLPLAVAWLLRYFAPKLHKGLTSIHGLSFYIWALALIIVTGTTTKFLVEQENPDYSMEIGMAVASLVICLFQFWLGRKIGRHYGDPISAGQALGQKNTVLAIWMAQAYLTPVSSLTPALYVLWQNCINAYQLWKKRGVTT
ncbi:transporter [Parabacteroides sp. OttesenSCG-928-N08]|nr:transporter [Parabacteroides sp. OttesenSCG-928-N08]